MNELYTTIGDHIIKFPNPTKYLIEMLNNDLPAEQAIPDLSITIQEGYGKSFTDYVVNIKKSDNKISFERADYLIEVDSKYSEAIVSVHNDLALKHALMNLYSSFIAYRNWGLLIHSSCAIENNSAHIFAGQSGAGKSTAAKLSYPRDLLSDEATILKITSENITVYNSPFRSELESSGTINCCSLSSIQLLNQAVQNRRLPIKKSDAFMELIDKVFYWEHNHEETKNVLKLLRILVSITPTYQLHFQKNNTFWELILNDSLHSV